MTARLDPLVFGQRLRHFRRGEGMTLAQLGEIVGKPASYLSMLETGKREPRLSLIADLAAAVSVAPIDLMAPEAPDRRSELLIALERAQTESAYQGLDLPYLKATARLPDDALEHLVGLYEEVKRRSTLRTATPEEARKANTALRTDMKARDNYFADVEEEATAALSSVGYQWIGPISQAMLTDLAAYYGFTVHSVGDLPGTTRSITDLENRRIYIPQRDAVGTRGARSVLLQTLGHFALGHSDPDGFSDYLRQRVEANYFAGAVLAPEAAAADFLVRAKAERDLSIEDLKEAFYVSYEMAAHRFTNLATKYLGIQVHFSRSDADGTIWKAYENDGVPYPVDEDGVIVGQRLCRQWATRQAFVSADKFAIHYQYTDTPAGTFWCSTHVEAGREHHHAVTVGVRFDDAQHFRGRDTDRRSRSLCPDESCCRRPASTLSARWGSAAWPSPRAHSHVLAALPVGTFPGVDLTEVYDFLERNASPG